MRSEVTKYDAVPQKTVFKAISGRFQAPGVGMSLFFKESTQNQACVFLPEGTHERILGVLTGL